MKNTLKYHFVVTLLFVQMGASTQIEFSTEFQGREYSSGSITVDKPTFSSSSSSGSSDRDPDWDRGNSNSSYSSNSSSSSNNYDWEDRKWENERREWERERRERETKLINETNKMLNNDCIDIVRMQYVIDEFDKISLGYYGPILSYFLII